MDNLFTILKEDLARLCDPTLRGLLIQYFFPRGNMYRYVFWFRIMCYVKQHSIIKILFGFPVYLVFRHYEFKYGIHLNTNIQIGKGIKILHGDGIYLNCKEIGEMFTVYQGVTLGVNGGVKVVCLQ